MIVFVEVKWFLDDYYIRFMKLKSVFSCEVLGLSLFFWEFLIIFVWVLGFLGIVSCVDGNGYFYGGYGNKDIRGDELNV